MTAGTTTRPAGRREAQRRRLDEILAELREAVAETVSPPAPQPEEGDAR
jgi:hypothetical protein